jgi:hypothetical protein
MLSGIFICGIISASLNFRQEMRWLYAPHLTLLIGSCILFGQDKRAGKWILSSFFAFVFVANLQSLGASRGIYMVGQGMEHVAIKNFHDSSNLVSGKHIFYRGTASQSRLLAVWCGYINSHWYSQFGVAGYISDTVCP